MTRPVLSRRSILAVFGGGLVLARSGQALAQAAFDTNPFSLGVAAGDPLPDGFVIWTRLAPDPLAYGSGMPRAPVAVKWEVAADRGFRTVVQSGEAVARPELGHSVHVEVGGLEPGRPYFYRFQCGSERSGTGRAKTTPVVGAALDAVRFGVAGCQAYEQGYYTAHRHMAEDDLDFVFLYGDYIYEGRSNPIYQTADGPQDNPRIHLGGEVFSLDDYRRRYSQYTVDADLQAARGSAAWFCTFDDHEVDNNWVGDHDPEGAPPEVFLLRRAAALQAFYEFMPMRKSAFPRGASMQAYRRAQYGNLLDVSFLDTRQFRSDQPCDDRFNSYCPGVESPEAQVLGDAQEAWLFNDLNRSTARWKALAQQVMMMDLNRNTSGGKGVNTDSWAGYRVPRNRLLGHIRDRRIDNVVVLTGDEHQNFAGGLWLDGGQPEGRPIAVEFVGTSISSGGNGSDRRADYDRFMAANPQLKFLNNQRGYLVCEARPDRWTTQFKVLDKVSDRDGTLSLRQTLVIEAGSNTLSAA
ncbi:alkaline phosphatase [Brevundimonas sp. SORGH_AS_0993]|uniref:alkaline phosphatase D family protein n=1 Tax=Brevundimonas sp. SORGH_AS_0993 TaxID=3041794 RepID=UPI0027817356|nr:alkaline phosphatase D family protein [Brevundimonas sp. SORGH_AS_0993]MDQ1154229.1 alkaline phosphatase D [Brevundimonas sp. SORGH_AS_0993]